MFRDLIILLVEDNPGDAALVRHLLEDAAPGHVRVDWVEGLEPAIEQLNRHHYDTVLLDLTLPESQGLETFLRLRAHVCETPIIVLTGNEDPKLPIAAVRAGAEDYLWKDRITGESLLRAILFARERSVRRVAERAERTRSASRRSPVLAFLGAKGGLGTTTTAVQTAWAFTQAGVNVILAEIRGTVGTMVDHFREPPSQRNVSTLWSLPPEKIDASTIEPLLVPVDHKLRLLLGPQTAREIRVPPESAVHSVIQHLRELAELVVVDLPAEPSLLHRPVLRNATFLGLVVDREPGTLRAAQVWLEQIRLWNVSTRVGTIVVSRVPLSAPLDPAVIGHQLHQPLTAVIPPGPDHCLATRLKGSPLFKLYPDSLIAESFLQLARVLGQQVGLTQCVA